MELNNVGEFPINGLSKQDILDDLETVCSHNKKYKSGKILNSICTSPAEISKVVFSQYLDLNSGDKRIFPGIIEIENKVIKMIGEILDSVQTYGIITSGGTEANILALYAAKKKYIKKHGYKTELEVIAPYSIHFSFEKACDILDLKLIMIPLDINQHVIHENYITYISDKTVAIIATAGTSETGAVDNITSISKIAKSYGIYFHVDAASGGFIIPFARKLGYKLPDLSLNIPGISSITIDPHKYGLSVIPSGVLVFNDKEYYDEIAFQSFFKLTSINRSLLGTRPGAATIATYAVMKNIGYNGYLTLTKQYFELREHLRHMLYSENLDFLFEPDLNIVTLKHPDVSSFITNMEKSNWIISQSKKYACLRIVLNKNVTIQTITDFFHIYINSISKYEKQNN